jgi:transcriptional regulator with XRE-family HTH domain
MKTPTTFNQLFESVRNTLQYKVEGVIIEFTEQVADRIAALHLNRTEFAARLNTSPAYVTKLLSGGTNFTLESMVKVADALDSEIQVEIIPKDSMEDWVRVLESSLVEASPQDQRLMMEWKRCSSADETSALIGAHRFDPDADFDEIFRHS